MIDEWMKRKIKNLRLVLNSDIYDRLNANNDDDIIWKIRQTFSIADGRSIIEYGKITDDIRMSTSKESI